MPSAALFIDCPANIMRASPRTGSAWRFQPLSPPSRRRTRSGCVTVRRRRLTCTHLESFEPLSE